MFSSNTSQVSNNAVFVEDVFSTWLYTGNGSTQTITNGIDLAGKGGLVWIKRRVDTPNASNVLTDTARGVQKELYSNSTSAQATNIYGLNSFNADGFGIGNASSYDYAYNEPNKTYASWTFREQPKFFDVVTYTGDGSTSKSIAHSLGSAPGCMIIKDTNLGDNWYVYHRSTGYANSTFLNLTNAASAAGVQFGGADPTSTAFTVGYSSGDAGPNFNGKTYVAYLFAHNAGGFGLTGTDNVISCGSFTTDASGNASVTLNYEPQWMMVKRSSGTSNWEILDTMRGWPGQNPDFTVNTQNLEANLSGAESTGYNYWYPTATGFQVRGWLASSTIIYIAIRRGPMKVPTDATKVFAPVATTNDNNAITTNFVVDALLENLRAGFTNNTTWWDRLRGGAQALITSSTSAETALGNSAAYTSNTTAWATGLYGSGSSVIEYALARAPGFFDVVCYTGTGVARTVTHNLGVAPELMIVRRRTTPSQWYCYCARLSSPANSDIWLNSSNPANSFVNNYWNGTNPTASVFSLSSNAAVNDSGVPCVAYLFASCPGVSKVGSYTGTGTTQQINCGFTGGARFVLIKRTDSTGDWYVWDSARGIVSGNDPYLLLNSTAAEVTNTDYVDTYAAGFEISSTAPAAINANGGTFIYLAIA